MFRKLLVCAAALAFGSIAFPATAAPKQQISCVKDNASATALRGMGMLVAFGAKEDADFFALYATGNECRRRYGWNAGETQIATSYAIAETVVELVSKELLEKGVDVPKLNAFALENFPAIIAAGGIVGYNRSVLEAEMVAAGIDVNEADTADLVMIYIHFRVEMLSLPDVFAAAGSRK